MAKGWQGINRFLKYCDLFYNSQFLRYKGQPQYSTAIGGFMSIAVFIVFVVLFARMGFQTVRKELINATLSTQYQLEPTSVTIKTSPAGGFMFGIGILGLNLNSPNVKYFNFELKQIFSSGLVTINSTTIPLVPCTAQHWTFNQATKSYYTDFAGDTWLCPPLGYQFDVGGKRASDISSRFEIEVSKCTNSSICISDLGIASFQQYFGQFTLAVPIVSTAFNAEDEEYHFPAYEDRNFFTFTTSRGFQSTAYIQQTKVKTDLNLIPIQNQQDEEFIALPQDFRLNPVSVINDRYAEIIFRKSPVSRTYTRSFNKIDEFFSYVGGLMGTILALIFILDFFSEKAFGVSLASEVYHDDDDKHISSTKFHIGYVIPVAIKEFLRAVGLDCFNWQATDYYMRCIEEVDEQLDVAGLLKRIMYLQKVASIVLDEHQLQTLHLHRKMPMYQVQQRRKKAQITERLKNSGNIDEYNQQHPQESPVVGTCNQIDNNPNDVVIMAPKQNEHYQFSEMSCSIVEIQFRETVREQVLRVLRQAMDGQRSSLRILQHINIELLPQLGINQQQINLIVELGGQRDLRVLDRSLQLSRNGGPDEDLPSISLGSIDMGSSEGASVNNGR